MKDDHWVAIADFITDDLAPERRILGNAARVVALDAKCEQDLIGRIEDADAIVLYHAISITRTTIERLRRCKVIVRGGVGYDNVDWRVAREFNIPVAIVPDYGSEEVADTAIGMTLALTRGIHLQNARLRSGPGVWDYSNAVPLTRLRGSVFGVVGLGRIGSAAALRAKALGMDVVFYDPHKPDGYDRTLGIRRAETLEELLAQSMVVSLHCPHTEETRGMIDAGAIARMPKGSYLVNTARGAIVDTSAIPAALESGHLAGSGIDVLPQEPPAEDDPLIVAWRDPGHAAHERLILNPHSAFYSEEGLMDIRTKSTETCRRAIVGEPLRNVVNS